ncbi:MAG: response regulator transcription factor [Pontiellaceae bacterium]|jgi:DNA-binding response OmpR family regulator|nr:response regulator transcription factor [Pontiellaceae bacterium]
MRILIAEDSRSLLRSLQTALRKTGYAVDAAEDGEAACWLAESNPYDVILLDLMLPKLSGLELLHRLRNTGNQTPVLILTALDAVDDRVKGLKTGADDYLTKPFALEELLARVEALLRRKHGTRSPHLRLGNLTIHTASHTAELGGRQLSLQPREYALLEYLTSRPGTLVTRTDIEAHLYDENSEVFSNTIDSAICMLRKKMTVPNQEVFIRTRKGLGYVLEVQT